MAIVRNPQCELNIFFVFQQQQNLGRRFGNSKLHLIPIVALAVARSKAGVLLLLIRSWLLLPLWNSVIVLCFCCALLCVHSSFAIISMGKRELDCSALFVFLVSHDCCVALPHVSMALSAVCDCGISWSYSLLLLFTAPRGRDIKR